MSNFLVSAYQYFGLDYSKFYKMDNLSKLGWLASEVLLNGSFIKENYRPEEMGIIIANDNSSLDSDLQYIASMGDIPSPSLFVYTLPNIMVGEICIRNNFKGENAFFVNDHFDAVFFEQYVGNLMDNHILKACIFGWVELLDEKYKACLFLVEKMECKESVPFTEQHLVNIFNEVL